jgi:MYXO-CTERM domain-containing protein
VDLGLLATLASAGAASAQSIPYEVRTEPAAYVPLPTIATQTVQPASYSLGYADWDEGAASVPIAFDFPWFGRRYRAIWVYTNGFFSFQAPPTGQAVNILGPPSSVPNPATVPHATIAALWQDLVGTPTAEIRYLAEGAAPNRRLTIQVSGLRRGSAPSSEVEYQLRLEESGLARITYGPRNFGVVGASVSVEDDVGVLGGNLLTANVSCAATCACGSRGCGSTNLQLSVGGELSIVLEPPATAELIGAIEGPTSASPGSSFTTTVTVSNVGLAAAGASRASVRLSLDPTVDASDQVLGSIAFPAIAGGASVTRAATFTMPVNVGVGRVYVGAIVDADAQITESNEGNNVARDPRGVATGPDFTVTVATTLSSGPGEDLDVILGLRTRDAPFRAPVPVELFLSRDATLDAGDRSLGTRSFTLPDGLALDTVWRLTLPGDLGAGAYRVIASVDPANVTVEVDEANNVAVSPGTLTLTLSDLQVTALTSAPVAFRGLPFPVEARVENRGGGGARGVEACLVLSRNPLVSVTTDPVIARSAPLTVLGGEVATLRFEPVLDTRTGTGTWNLALVADCEDRVAESSEVNNTRRRDPPIRVVDPAPDLTALEVRTASTAAAGEVLSATVLVGNYGVVDGAASVRFVLTSAAVATPSDRILTEVPMPRTLAPGRETTFAAQLPIPGELASGRYVVGAVVDPLDQVVEVDETNNVASARAIQIVGTGVAIVSPAPPNAIVDVGYAWRFQALGGTPPYTWSVAWGASGAPAGLVFDAARGELAGTPTAVGTHTLTVTARADGEVATATYTLLVTPPTLPLGVVSSKLPPALERESYAARLVAVGGAPPYRWSLVSARNTLPAGLGVVESGEVAGQAVGPGAYAFRVRVVDASGNQDEADLAIDVVDPRVTLSITTTDVPSGQVGEAYERVFEVTGGTEPYRWRFDGAPIPGLSFDADAAKLVGTPTVSGSYGFVVEARDARGLLDRNAYVLRVFEVGDLAIVTGRAEDARLPTATLNEAYLAEGQPVQLRAALRSGGAVSGVSWLVVLGDLPPGLSLDGTTGVIAGVPTTAGVFAFNVLATTPNGDRDRVTLAITVDDPTDTPPIADPGCGCSAGETRSSGVSLFALVLAWPLLRRRRGRASSARVAALAAAVAAASVAVLFSAPARAQTVEYQVTTTRAPYVELVGAQPFSLPFGLEVAPLDLPFDVYVFDTPTRRLELTAAGVVGLEGTFGATSFVGGPPQNAPSAAAPNGFIAALWGDWCSPTSFSCFVSPSRPDAGLYTRLDPPDPAVGGRRSVTIEWRALPSGNDFDTPSVINVQLRAFEGFPPRLDLSYGLMVQGASFGFPSPFRARIGVESADGTRGGWIAPCGGASPCDAGAVVGLTGTRITLEGRGVRDLLVTEVDAPPQAFEGRSFPVEVTVVSADEVELGPVDLDLYAHNLASTSTANAVRVGSVQGLRFAPFERKRVAFTPQVQPGQAPGRYVLLAVVDAGRAVAERDERNNQARSGTVQYFEAKPDLWVDGARVTSPSGTTRPRAGGQLQLEYTLANRGSPTATVDLACVASRNASLTPSDLRLTTVARTVAGGERRVERLVCELPESLDPGAYLFGVIVDPDARVEELLETNNVAAIAAPIAVSGGPLRLLTDSLPVATLTRPYTARLEVAGGFDVATAQLVSGELPRGLELDGARREIHGVPLQVGRFPLEVQLDDGRAQVRGGLVLDVLDPRGPLTMVTRALPDGLVGEPYQAAIQVAGGAPPLVWRLDGALPDGIALSTDGVLFGTPRAAGPSRFAVAVSDATSRTATASLSLDVRTPGNLTLVARALPTAYVDADYAETLLALGGRPPYGWALVSGAVPGLTLAENGALVGRPTEVGTYDLVVRVFDAEGAVDTAAFPVSVESRRRMAIVADAFGRATVDLPFRGRLRVEGGRRPYDWTVVVGEGALPGGLRAVVGDPTVAGESSNDFVIAGVPTQLGTWPITVRVRDAQGTVASLPIAVVVEAQPALPEPQSGCGVAPGAPGLIAVGLASLFFVRARRRRAIA